MTEAELPVSCDIAKQADQLRSLGVRLKRELDDTAKALTESELEANRLSDQKGDLAGALANLLQALRAYRPNLFAPADEEDTLQRLARRDVYRALAYAETILERHE